MIPYKNNSHNIQLIKDFVKHINIDRNLSICKFNISDNEHMPLSDDEILDIILRYVRK